MNDIESGIKPDMLLLDKSIYNRVRHRIGKETHMDCNLPSTAPGASAGDPVSFPVAVKRSNATVGISKKNYRLHSSLLFLWLT